MNRLNILNRGDSRICKLRTLIPVLRHKSYYHSLELDSSASSKDIKSAYYKLSLLHHPDKNDGSEESVAKFREITEAYKILGNPDKKKKYDEEHSFQSQYTSRSYGYQTHTRETFRSRNSGGPFTGKTKDFDYDEHYKQHYEALKKQRQMELEYFRRRWEADFYRRYPTKGEYYRNRDKHVDEESQQLYRRVLERRKAYIFLTAFWTFVFFSITLSDWKNPERFIRNPIYYHVSTRNEDVDISKESSDRDF